MNREQKRKAGKDKDNTSRPLPANALPLALSLHKAGQLQQAEIIYEEIVRSQPENSQALNYFGVLKAQKGDNKGAVSFISKAVKLEPENFGYLNNLGNAYRANEQIDDAIASYERALKVNPESADSHLNLGIALTEKGAISEAMTAIEKCLAVNQSHPRALHALGDLFLAQGELENAIESYVKSLSINPRSFDVLSSLGMALYRQGNLRESQNVYEQALVIDPYSTEALANIGATFYEQGRIDAAEACCRAVIELDANATDAYVNLGFLLSQQGKEDEAIDTYDRALKQQPKSIPAMAGLAEILGAKQSKWDEAIALYRKILDSNRNSPEAHTQLGIGLREAGDVEAAIAQFSQAIEINPVHTKSYAHLGLALQDVGKISEAESIFNYSGLVSKYQFGEVEGWESLDAYNADLAKYVCQHPTLLQDRPGKPINRGRQTFEIFADRAPVMAALREQINSFLQIHLSNCAANSENGFFQRLPNEWRLSGWAVVLESEGFQNSHIHPESYCSGVYYIQVPDAVKENNSGEGFLNFGTSFPAAEESTKVDKYTIRPNDGLLTIFPSYLWHSTIPFFSDRDRICISFNMIPVAW